MRDYALRYAFWVLLLFSLLYFQNYSPLYSVSTLQTSLTSVLTAEGIDLFHLPIMMHGSEIVMRSGLHLYILHECNAMAPILLFSAAVWSYPTSMRNKVLWTVMGYLFLVLLNVGRILFVLYVVDIDKNNLEWSHHYVGRYGMGLLTLGLFWIFTDLVKVTGYYNLSYYKKEKK